MSMCTGSHGRPRQQTIKVFIEAEAYNGPSLILAYSHCIAHGIDREKASHSKNSPWIGFWPLYRYNPALLAEGKNPFTLDSQAPTIALKDYIYTEARYRMLQQSDPATAELLAQEAQEDVYERWHFYERLAAFQPVPPNTSALPASTAKVEALKGQENNHGLEHNLFGS